LAGVDVSFVIWWVKMPFYIVRLISLELPADGSKLALDESSSLRTQENAS
jgi:hypothetical protein